MSCSSCGDTSCGGGSSCGSCADSCNPCNGPKTIISKQGLQGIPGTPGAAYFFEVAQSIDFLDTFIIDNPNTDPGIDMGQITILASVAGQAKSYDYGTPVRLTPTAQRTNAGTVLVPVPKIEGFVVSYDILTGVLVMNVLGVSGVGTYTEWDVDLNWHISTARYLNGITLPPSGAAASHGNITIPGNTIFATEHTVKITINGNGTGAANPLELSYDGAVCFSKVLTVASDFQLDIEITLGYYVTISTKLITTVGTDDTIQFLGMNNATYLLSTYKPNFKTDKLITFTDFGPTQPVTIYSGMGVRL